MPLGQIKEGLGQLYQTLVRLLSLIQARLFNQPAYFLNFIFIENVSSRSQGGTKGCPSTSLSSRDMREFKGKPVFQHISRNLKQSCLRCLPAVLQAMCCHSFFAVSNIQSRTLDLPVSTGNSGRVLGEDLTTKILSVFPFSVVNHTLWSRSRKTVHGVRCYIASLFLTQTCPG